MGKRSTNFPAPTIWCLSGRQRTPPAAPDTRHGPAVSDNRTNAAPNHETQGNDRPTRSGSQPDGDRPGHGHPHPQHDPSSGNHSSPEQPSRDEGEPRLREAPKMIPKQSSQFLRHPFGTHDTPGRQTAGRANSAAPDAIPGHQAFSLFRPEPVGTPGKTLPDVPTNSHAWERTSAEGRPSSSTPRGELFQNPIFQTQQRKHNRPAYELNLSDVTNQHGETHTRRLIAERFKFTNHFANLGLMLIFACLLGLCMYLLLRNPAAVLEKNIYIVKKAPTFPHGHRLIIP